MKLGELILSRGVIGKVYNAPPAVDGDTFLKLKRVVKKMVEEIDGFESAKNERIKKTGKTAIEPKDPEFQEIVKFIADMENSEIDLAIEPVLDERAMVEMKLSISDQDKLEKLGLVRSGEVK